MKIPALPFFVFLVASVSCGSGSGPAYGQEFRAWLELQEENNGISVEAFGQALQNSQVHYELETEKQGKSGRTVSLQQGMLTLDARIPTRLSRTWLSVNTRAGFQIRLRLIHDGRIVAEESLEIPADGS
ncbi:MAG: hypothetical protein A2521_11875 [Deltaproteobacteria bacterium RIFOXYD12_FULL_57_12]|nr:MAG: hypothetical protein A2521_11875 [Deltaproteobacteria bacterium RIFOXYD12_FULL_57_12]